MRAPGAKIPGAPDGWSPPGIPENWCGYKPKKNSGAPSEEDIDNLGSWNLYLYTPVYDKKNYVQHKTPAGAIVVPKQPPAGERKVGDWTFHYNGWWPSDFDRDTYVRGSAKREDLKPLDRMGYLDVDVLKKHGLNANRVKNALYSSSHFCFQSVLHQGLKVISVSQSMEWTEILECPIFQRWHSLQMSTHP
jgi:hypothetical protein